MGKQPKAQPFNGSSQKARSPRKAKDPNAPKGPRNAFSFWSSEARSQIQRIVCVCVCGWGCVRVCGDVCSGVRLVDSSLSLSLARARSRSPPFPPSLPPTLPHAPYLPPASSIDMYNNDVGQKSAINL